MPLKFYVSDDPKHPTKGYGKWLKQQIYTGVNFPKSELEEIVQASAGFIRVIQQKVDYIRVYKGFLKTARRDPDLFFKDPSRFKISEDTVKEVPQIGIFFDRKQLHDFLMYEPVYTRQTFHADLETAYDGDQELAARHLELEQQIDDLQEKIHKLLELKDPKYLDNDKLEKLCKEKEAAAREFGALSEFCEGHKKAMGAVMHRSKIKPVPVEPFEWWKCDYFPANQFKKWYKSTEMMYRDMFLSAAVKICFGKRKTYFVIPKQPEHTLLVTVN